MSPPTDKDPGSGPGEVPKAVVSRLSLYLRELQRLLRDGFRTTSSTQLGKLLDLTDAQVRKDLAYFGQFGHPGIGYHCDELVREIKRILGTNQPWPVALVGVGNLGRALLGYRGFEHQGFKVLAAFDVDPSKVESSGPLPQGLQLHHVDKLKEVVEKLHIRLGVIAVPADAAQDAADRLVHAGVDGVLNFAPVTLSLPKRVSWVGVDLAIELEQLAFAVANRRE